MKAPGAPFSLEVVSNSVIKPRAAGGSNGKNGASGGGSGGGTTPLSVFDATIVATSIGRAISFPAPIDPKTLAAALQQTVDDLPFLAGRFGGLKKLRLDSLAIQHTGEGVPFTVVRAEGASLAVLEPEHWPRSGVTIAQPAWPWYLERMDVGKKLLSGQEPLMRVRLTQLDDGSVLGFTFCHSLFDGTRWPAFASHLAARYVAAAGGQQPGKEQLLRPCDRRQLSVEHMKAQLLGEGAGTWVAPKTHVRASLLGYWHLFKLLMANNRQTMDLLLLHIPQKQVAALKQMAADGTDLPITSGDAVQAAAALLMHTADGRPLLPVAPKHLAVIVQLPAPESYFGNGCRLLRASMPAGTPQPAAHDAPAALRALASAIRKATAAFRTSPEEQLKAMADTEALAAAPAPRMLAFLASKRRPLLTCSLNYVPAQPKMDLGLGTAALVDRELTHPLARGMVVIRGAEQPYSDGLLVQLCVSPQAAKRLRQHPLLKTLLPLATWVGSDA
ncbi:putative acetyltransferase isoform X2 isoform A [Chlorella sorokiniana]|uniref:Acetyltransferase isoform X2 isoform A n=1 Tax=Chlorella sorokiniana TaxID=3076 RepID=A0A2P6TD73_CHLSO|nr:putative acetyltransferase isoform X2 isoform A [Chlorella sorokiniana]|eukprot:PRW20583.1 putative acetyltransferase isoform X2 isoform A [Chlorella sorokiniana]